MNPYHNQRQILLLGSIRNQIVSRMPVERKKNSSICCQKYQKENQNNKKKNKNKKKDHSYTEYADFSPSHFHTLNLASDIKEEDVNNRSRKTSSELERAIVEIQNTFTKPLSHSEKQYVCDILLEILSRSEEKYLNENHEMIEETIKKSKALGIIARVLDYYDIFE